MYTWLRNREDITEETPIKGFGYQGHHCVYEKELTLEKQ